MTTSKEKKRLRLERKKLAERERRRKMKEDPCRIAEENRKQRERYAARRVSREDKRVTMSDRMVREQRRKWRIAKRNQKAKKPVNELLTTSEAVCGTSQAVAGKKKRNLNKMQRYLEKKKLDDKISSLERLAAKYKKRSQRLAARMRSESNSPRSKLDSEYRNERISPKVKRRLLFASALERDLKSSYRSISTKTSQCFFMSALQLKYVAQYRFMSVSKPFFPWNTRSDRKKADVGVRARQVHMVRKCVNEFFLQDDVTYQAPGKRDFIKHNKQRKQKRYLSNCLLYLHRKFCDENSFVISYALFCRLKPFWALNRNVTERDTCLCVKHENMILVHKRLRELKIFPKTDLDTLIEESMCCDKVTENCLLRKCTAYEDKMIIFAEFNGEEESYYDLWEKVEESRRDQSTYKRTKKNRVKCTTSEVVSRFDDLLPEYMIHAAAHRHQYHEIDELKKRLTDKDYLIHVDFAENYACKYHREIQAVHYGGNRLQISLHTVVVYRGSSESCNPLKKSFCTATQDLHHDPIAILAHLEPILKEYVNPEVENLHFLSDSPSPQYRNTAMFYVMKSRIIPIFSKLKSFTWNYSETGYGKGAVDGIGGRVKNACDKMVARGIADISNFEDFWNCVEDCFKSIKIIQITTERDCDLQKEIKTLRTAKGEKS